MGCGCNGGDDGRGPRYLAGFGNFSPRRRVWGDQQLPVQKKPVRGGSTQLPVQKKPVRGGSTQLPVQKKPVRGGRTRPDFLSGTLTSNRDPYGRRLTPEERYLFAMQRRAMAYPYDSDD